MINLCLVTFLILTSLTHAAQYGGSIRGLQTIARTGGPHTVTSDLIVEPLANLTIEPGTELRFMPGTKLRVRGTLHAEGTSSQRIKFTNSNGDTGVPNWPDDIRLANGSGIHEGVVQVLYRGEWRAICDNSANWTVTEAQVVCRQLGFSEPFNNYFTYNFTATDYHKYIEMKQPGCTGEEDNIFHCTGAQNPLYSSQICREQRSLYLKCRGLRSDIARDHWHGIEFFNTTMVREVLDSQALNKSTSVLRYADILYAGVTKEHLPVAAVSASPYVPLFEHVKILYSAHDGLNMTDINSTCIINNCEIAYNRGQGLNVTTGFGRVWLTGTDVHHNGGNGINVRTVDKIFRYWNWRTGDFCTNSVGSSYPQLFTGMAQPGTATCSKQTWTAPGGYFITVAALEFYKDPNVKSALLYMYNGDCRSSNCQNSLFAPLLTVWNITNLESGTIGLPQSQVTSTGALTIEFKLDKSYQHFTDCTTIPECVKFRLFIDIARGEPAADVKFDQVQSYNNLLYGVLIENPRSFIKVANSRFSDNQYGAGFAVRGGSCDISMIDTVLQNNANSGLNVTYSGGRAILQRVTSQNNTGVGMYFDSIKEHKTRIERHMKTELIRVTIKDNLGVGVRSGNYCHSDSIVLINDSSRISNNHYGVHLQSCYHSSQVKTNLSISDVTFRANKYQSVILSPMLDMIGMIRNSTFTQHTKGCILIDNTDDLQRSRAFLDKTVDYAIESNDFYSNSGRDVVNIRLTETDVQTLIFRYNKLYENSIGDGEDTGLKHRSRAPAVLVISSSNVIVNRNSIINPDSPLEVSTHSLDTQLAIDIKYNWWGSDNLPGDTSSNIETHIFEYHRRIAGKLMDKQNRYNLAELEYHPALVSSDIIFDKSDSSSVSKFDRPFDREDGGVYRLGGILKQGFETVSGREYIVDSDIQVKKGIEFKIKPGTILHFDNTVGARIDGKLYAVGTQSQPIRLQRHDDIMQLLPNVTWMRLVGGATEYEGILETNVTGDWGTVCNKGWTMFEAGLVCKQFGLTLQPETYQMERPFGMSLNSDTPITISYVRCRETDIDIRDCEYDVDFNDCTHAHDIVMRCVLPTWAGVTLSASADVSQLQFVHIKQAGLLDHFTHEFSPALQIDMYDHIISDIQIYNTSSTGLRIAYTDPFGKDRSDISRVNEITRSKFYDNVGDGVHTMSSYLTFSHCEFSNNRRSGFVYDPKITQQYAYNIRRSIAADEVISIDRNVQNPIQPDGEGVVKYLQAKNVGIPEQYEVIFEVKAATAFQRVTVQLLDYSPETNVEQLVIYDSNRASISEAVRTYIEDDVVDLPLVSSSDTLTFKYTVNGVISGRLFIIISSRSVSDVPEVRDSVPQTVRATLRLEDCVLQANNRGLLFINYNNPSNEYMDLFVRHRYEQVILNRVTVRESRSEALFVPSVTKYNEIYMPDIQSINRNYRISNITYVITNSTFIHNEDVILAEHNHVDFTNNMYRWKMTDNLIQNNENGGLKIELPIILDPYNNGNHSIELNNSRFINNKNCEISITGGYANLTLYRNTISQNSARFGLVTISGTEKKMLIEGNTYTENKANYILELNIGSHSEFGVHHSALIHKNEFRDNSPLPSTQYKTTPDTSYSIKHYTLSLRGVQKVNITRNLFVDPLMELSFVADVPSTSLQTNVNVTENYWATIDQSEIEKKIFDFNDWSSFAVADYWPFLIYNDFNSVVTAEARTSPVFDLSKPLHGLITQDLVIPYRNEPYQVISDITVNQSVTVRIEAGVKFRMSPNVGILVLGTLLANGLSEKRIQFLPTERTVLNQQTTPTPRPISEITEADGLCHNTILPDVRLCGNKNEKEGFIMMYNQTIKSWSLICDTEFNYNTAEVLCRSLGFSSDNVAVRNSELFEFFTFGKDRQLYQDLWTRTFLCNGYEDNIADCPLRINYNLAVCSKYRRYVYIKCGERNLEQKYHYWGNIRFAADYSAAGSSNRQKRSVNSQRSSLRYVDIVGAGRLHELKVPAVMSTFKTISTYEVTIRDCASDGLNFIAPQSDLFLLNSRVENNLGRALNILVLNGETTTQISRFKPLNTSSIPYNVYGMVNMCDSEKVLTTDKRLLIYYKYDFNTVDCVKVIQNKHRKQLSIRFLQLNLFHDDFSRNYIEIFDGPEFTRNKTIITLDHKSSDQTKARLYTTTDYFNFISRQEEPQFQMGLHIHANAASGVHGFIAEVTTDASSRDGTEGTHRIIGNKFINNQGGAVRYSTVGEKNPGILLNGNEILSCGLDVLNLTSTDNILIEAQNVADLSVSNNMLSYNNGSMTVWLYADGDSSVRGANISNNVIIGTINGEAVRVYGNKIQRIKILYNYITKNRVDNLNTIDLRDVIVNVTGNTVVNNQGAHCIDVWSNTATTDIQTVQYNQFYMNHPGDKFKDSGEGGNNTLMYISGYNKLITQNWFQNKYFAELSSHNRSKAEKPLQFPWMRANASYNFWGNPNELETTDATVEGKIHHNNDSNNLTYITFKPYYSRNYSLLQGDSQHGYCLPGWTVSSNLKCYRYYGGISSYLQARSICELENGTIVEPKNRFWADIGDVIAKTQQDYSDQIRAWVNEPKDSRSPLKCSVIIANRYAEANCNELLPVVCEFEQIGVPADPDLLYVWIILGVVSFLILCAVAFAVVWCLKCQVRKEQRFERRASLRSSIRSNKYAITNGALTHASRTNIDSSVYGGESRYRTRAASTTAQSVALTDVTQGETDVDQFDDTETVFTGVDKSQYTPSTVHGSAENSLQGSRDNLSAYQPISTYPPNNRQPQIQTRHNQPEPLIQTRRNEPEQPQPAQRATRSHYTQRDYEQCSNPSEDYYPIRSPDSQQSPTGLQNEGYSTDQSSPRYAPPSTRPNTDNPQPHQNEYVNTSNLQPKNPERTVEDQRRLMYNQTRPSRPPPDMRTQQPPSQLRSYNPRPYTPRSNFPSSQPSPSHTAPARNYEPANHSRPFVRARQTEREKLSPSDYDTKSIDSFSTMSDMSYAKPPPSYHSLGDDLKKPFETDIDSINSSNHTDRSPLYNPSSRSTQPRDNRTPAQSYQPAQRRGVWSNLHGADGADFDNMSQLTDDSWYPQGPPTETEF